MPNELSLFKRIRRWIIWIGGWEKSNSSGWEFTIEHSRCRGGKKVKLLGPTPVALFGHRITFQSFGINIMTPLGYLCWHWRRSMRQTPSLGYCYLSPNGTPWAATKWFWGKKKGPSYAE